MKQFLLPLLLGPTLGATLVAAPPPDLIQSIEQVTVKKGRDGGTTWFHPRGCMIPGPKGAVAFVTLQDITGSDHFGPVHWMQSADLGRSWSEPVSIPGLGRQKLADGSEEGVCDVVPEYHPQTKTILAIGHNVFYKGNRFFVQQPPRWPVYVVRDVQGQWSAPQKLAWADPRGQQIYTCGCAQRLTLDNGDILIPLSFGPDPKTPRAVAVALCAFDGKTLAIRKVGNALHLAVGRGLLEPSLARLGKTFYMTIRAEDGHGYITTSPDGLTWQEPTAWQWDTGEAIAMSTTQQRWLVHADQLYLVYTRKAEANAKVMRWRAPLFVAPVNPSTLRLVKSQERLAVPMVGDGRKAPKQVAHLGNFHTMIVTPHESWITVGEVIPANFRGDLLLARVRWTKPNRLAENMFSRTP